MNPLDEILVVSVEEPEYLSIIDGTEPLEGWLNFEQLHELVITREIYDDTLRDFLEDIFLDPVEDATGPITLNMIDTSAIISRMEARNEEYCEENGLCPVCHSELTTVPGGPIEAWGHMTRLPDEVVCPNGCI